MQEGQLDPALIEKRDKECGVDSKAREQVPPRHSFSHTYHWAMHYLIDIEWA